MSSYDELRELVAKAGLKPTTFRFADEPCALLVATPQQIRDADRREVWTVKGTSVGKSSVLAC